jgi:hypothetical protein
MPRKYFVTLMPEERDTLRTLIDKRSAKALEVKRAYVLLALDENRAGGSRTRRFALVTASPNAALNAPANTLSKKVWSARAPAKCGRNGQGVKVSWQFTTKEARVKLKRLSNLD